MTTEDRGGAAGEARPPMTHELKTWPKFFAAVLDGSKTFEVRKADRDFRVGDELRLREFIPSSGISAANASRYTGRIMTRRVTYILGEPAPFAFPGFVVMGLSAAIPGRAGEDVVERVARAIHGEYVRLSITAVPWDRYNAEQRQLWYDMARAAVAEVRGGEIDPEAYLAGEIPATAVYRGNSVGYTYEKMRNYGRQACEQKERAEKAEAERDEVRSQLEHHRSELNTILHPDGGAPKRPALCDLVAYVRGDLAKASKERDEARKRVAELEAALRGLAIRMHDDGDGLSSMRAREIEGLLEPAGKRGGERLNTADGEARMAAADQTLKRQQDEERG